jgi:hypothetical protein
MNSFGLNRRNCPQTATPLNHLILSSKLHIPTNQYQVELIKVYGNIIESYPKHKQHPIIKREISSHQYVQSMINPQAFKQKLNALKIIQQ